jgi:hypothetical protein
MSGKSLTTMLRSELRAMQDVSYFVEDPELLNAPWMWPKQKEVIRDFYTEAKKYRDMILIWGMRAGKTTVASVIACYEAFKLINMGYPNRRYGLPKGTEIFIINVATSDRQARDTVFAHTKARIDNSPWFQRQKVTEHFNEFIFKVKDGTVIIRSEHSNSASLAGKTVICATFDELSRFKDTGGNQSGEMVYDTLSRSVRTFGGDGKRVVITSPMYNDDYAMRLYGLYKNNPHWYCRKYPTWEVNPTITFQDLEDEFLKDPESAWRDYGATPSAALEVYFKEPEKIYQCMRTDIKNPVNPDAVTAKEQIAGFVGLNNVPYTLAGDPALKNDAFGLCLSHQDNKTDKVIVDLLHRFTPTNTREEGDESPTAYEVNASFVREFIFELNKKCWIETFITDTWQFPETIQAIRGDGITVEQNHVTKTEYDKLKELMYTKRIEYPNYEFVIEELKSLEMLRSQRIDHPRGGSKDVADAMANSVWYATSVPSHSEVPIALTFKL